MLRAAAYLRVSSQPQEAKYGFEIQMEAALAYAERIGASILNTHRDVITGTSATRHGLEQLKRAAPDYDIVIIPRTDRLARDILVGPAIVSELMAVGLTVHMSDFGAYNPDDPASVFLFAISLAKSHTDRTTIATNLEQGKLRKAARGELVRPIRAYGYRDNQPYEPEARWVRQMFEWALSRGRYTIARRLNDLGVPVARNGAQWRVSSVSSVLTNPVYKGKWQYGRRLSCPGCGRRDRLPRNISRTVTFCLPQCRCGERMRLERYEVEVPPLVAPELWDAVHDRQRARYRERSRPGSRTDTFPLQGRAFCAVCGSTMSGHRTQRGYTYYHCRGSLQLADRPRCEHNRYYRAAEINEAVREALQLCLNDDEALRRSLELPAPEPVDYERERAQLRLELQNYVRLAGRDLITDEELAAERERLERALTLISDSPPPLPTPQARHLAAWRERVQGLLAGDDLHAVFTAADALVRVAPEKMLEIVVR